MNDVFDFKRPFFVVDSNVLDSGSSHIINSMSLECICSHASTTAAPLRSDPVDAPVEAALGIASVELSAIRICPGSMPSVFEASCSSLV